MSDMNEFRAHLRREIERLHLRYHVPDAARPAQVSTNERATRPIERPKAPSPPFTDEFTVDVRDVVAHLDAAFRYVPIQICETKGCEAEIRQSPNDPSPRLCQICAGTWRPR